MQIYFSITKLLLGLLFGAVCGFVSGLFLTRSTYSQMTEIDENDKDMTDYSASQLNQYDTEFRSFSERIHKAEKSEFLKYVGMTAGAFLVWILVLVFLFASSKTIAPKKVIANIGVGESGFDSNIVVDIAMDPVTVDSEGRAVIPYTITNKTDLSLETLAIIVNVTGRGVECFSEKAVEGAESGELQLEAIADNEPVVKGTTATYYVVLDSKSLKQNKISDIETINITFDTCTIDFENGNTRANETQIQMSQKVTK